VLNVRLYRTCWLVAGVALVVALLTLETPDAGPDPVLPSAIDGQGTLELENQLAAIAPERPAGSDADLQAAEWVRGQLAQVPGGAGRVQIQELVARSGNERVSLTNVYLVVPGSGGLRTLPGILVVAPRDTPVGVSGGASATAVMLRLARSSATTRHERPHLFVSTDGSTVGNAGIRWFLRRFSSFPLEAAIVLDGPGDAQGDRIHVWTRGRTDRQSVGVAPLAERAIDRAGGRVDATPSLVGQLLGLAVPQTFGDQGAAIAMGVPAVTLSGRGDSPLASAPAPTAERMELVANAANDLLGALDSTARVPSPDGSLELAGKRLRPTAARLALLLLALPVLALAVDAAAALRRARVPIGPGVRAAGLRALPLLAALATAHLLSLGGLLPRPAAGVPPLPAEARFGAAAGLGLVVALAVGVFVSAWARRRARRLDVPPAAEGTAALVALAVVLLAVWIASPFALVLALPAAHAAAVGIAARRPWHLAALAGLALLPILALVLNVASHLDSNPIFAAWYLVVTTTSGARGAVGPIAATLVIACLWSMALHVLLRARKGRAAPPRPRPRRRARYGATGV
jgi:hypothetical protein